VSLSSVSRAHPAAVPTVASPAIQDTTHGWPSDHPPHVPCRMRARAPRSFAPWHARDHGSRCRVCRLKSSAHCSSRRGGWLVPRRRCDEPGGVCMKPIACESSGRVSERVCLGVCTSPSIIPAPGRTPRAYPARACPACPARACPPAYPRTCRVVKARRFVSCRYSSAPSIKLLSTSAN